MPCDEADTFARRVVMRAKLIVGDHTGTAAPDPPTAPAAATATVPAERRKYGR